jgi:hypothetical protein
MSSVWGIITHMNTINKTHEEIIEEKLDLVNDYDIHELIVKSDREYYELVPKENPYLYNIRIKPFLISYARINIAKVILKHIDNFVRVQTDGACFLNEINYSEYKGLLPEGKTTGSLKWNHVNQAEDSTGKVIIGTQKVTSSLAV